MNKKITLITALIIALSIIPHALSQETEGLYLDIDSVDATTDNVKFNLNAIKTEIKDEDKISIGLGYNKGTIYDEDDDGVEELSGVIDFTVKNSEFKEINKDNICTRWEVFSIDNDKTTTVCYGNERCCNFINLIPTKEEWDEPLYLTYGLYETTENNKVSAQIIHVEYNLSFENPFSEVFYSDWASLEAIFNEEESETSIDDKIENIKKNNDKIKSIKLLSEDDREIQASEEVKEARLKFNIKRSSGIGIMSDAEEDSVSIKGFDTKDAEWEKSEDIRIETEDNLLEEELFSKGIKIKKAIYVRNVNSFLEDQKYSGEVRLKADSEFNKVLYCPDDSLFSCINVKRCNIETNQELCYNIDESYVNVFVPHFSSIILAMDNSTINLTIESPNNGTSLVSGENVYLNITSNNTVNLFYSLDNNELINLSTGQIFSTTLNETQDYGIIKNGEHKIFFLAYDQFENNKTINYTFYVNDTTAPKISVNFTNNSIIEGVGYSKDFKLTSTEYSTMKYKINDNAYSTITDLGEDKTEDINILIEGGENELWINLSDLQNNSKIEYYKFTYNNLGNCSDATKNSDETGIDCGGRCSAACIDFSISLNKDKFNLTDNVYLTVISRASSSVELTVKKSSQQTYTHTFTPVFSGAPISETRLLENTDDAGTYIISAVMTYLNITETKTSQFEVLAPQSNPLSVTINANSTTIDEGETVGFSASVSGNTGSITYKWDLNNDGTIDNTTSRPKRFFGTNGTFTVNLTVFDDLWNQTDIETITVKKLFNTTFIVKDNESKAKIEDADVEFNDILKNTSSDGKVIFTNHKGSYKLKVSKPGYKVYSRNFDVEKSETVNINLTKTDETPPKILLIAPQDEASIEDSKVDIRYKAQDETDMTCKLYLARESSSFWELKGTNSSVKSDSENKFRLENLDNLTYEWKIECIDREGNSNSSQVYSFSVDSGVNQLSVDLDEQDQSTGDIVTELNKAIEDLSSLNSKDKEASEEIGIKNKLEKAITTIQRANRDLHSLKWRRLNDTELEIETQKILDKIEDAKKNTPRSIEVTDSLEFVKYPEQKDIEEVLKAIINQTNLKFTDRDIRKLAEKNDKIQNLITVTTNAKNANLIYPEGRKEEITIIRKAVQAQEDLEGVSFYEVIPKEIAEKINDTEILFEYDIIKEDPIIKIDIGKIKEYVYYIKKNIDIKQAENTRSVLLEDELKQKKGSFITGFSIFEDIASGFVDGSDMRLIIEILVIIILAALYLVYSTGSVEKIKEIFEGKDIKEIQGMIIQAKSSIEKNDYEDASKRYREINQKFSSLDRKKKEHVKPDVIDIANKVNIVFINKLVKDAQKSIELGNKKEGFDDYRKIQSLYSIIPKQYKANVVKRCVELHKRLNLPKN